jgi:chemotaxis protein MotA
MEGLKDKEYLSGSRRRFDPIAILLSVGLLGAVLIQAIGSDVVFGGSGTGLSMFGDSRSFLFVVGGTLGVLLFQFDIETFIRTFMLVFRSLIGSPTKHTNESMQELDDAIVEGGSLLNLRDGEEINGELLNDIVHMVRERLFYEEIEDFVTSRVATLFLVRQQAVALLNKGAKIAPALGLLGTVIGLIEMLQSLDDPAGIGPAMSLALMTTAFGSILGSLVFTPLAGRLEHQNRLYIETHKQLMTRVGILMRRQDKQLEAVRMNQKLEPAS